MNLTNQLDQMISECDARIAESKRKMWELGISLFLQACGYLILVLINWKIAVALFLIEWARNLARKSQALIPKPSDHKREHPAKETGE